MAQTATGKPTEVLAGLVERVTFHNEENGFCVLRVKARGQRDQITVLGHAAIISAGEFVQATGTWANDRTLGVQFRASFLKVTAPTTVEGIEKYLGSGMIRGIGPSTRRSSCAPLARRCSTSSNRSRLACAK
jgi:exodeoxyribonuclease V alpha subunit